MQGPAAFGMGSFRRAALKNQAAPGLISAAKQTPGDKSIAFFGPAQQRSGELGWERETMMTSVTRREFLVIRDEITCPPDQGQEHRLYPPEYLTNIGYRPSRKCASSPTTRPTTQIAALDARRLRPSLTNDYVFKPPRPPAASAPTQLRHPTAPKPDVPAKAFRGRESTITPKK